jgi:antitoxin (DNA-binding transcriptional repressor) of toxin-antitoxin stability system
MTTIIGLKDLRENIDNYISQLHKGKSFLVVRRSRPVFRLEPPDADAYQWERVIDFGKIKKGGVDLNDILARL